MKTSFACDISRGGVATVEIFIPKGKCKTKKIMRDVACACGVFAGRISPATLKMCTRLFKKPTSLLLLGCRKRFKTLKGQLKLFRKILFISTKCFRPFPTGRVTVREENEVDENNEAAIEELLRQMVPSAVVGAMDKCVKCLTCLDLGNCEMGTPSRIQA